MALQHDRVVEVADAAAELADELAKLHARVVRFLAFNSHQAIDWAAGSTPAYITEEANGNISGRTFTRQQVANIIGTLDQMRKLLANEDVSAARGDHLGNLNQLAKAR